MIRRSYTESMANSQQLAVDAHPQKQRIVTALLNQESPYSIAKWVNPPISKVTIWRYRRNHVAPALRIAPSSWNETDSLNRIRY
jgi:hypothetical protein